MKNTKLSEGMKRAHAAGRHPGWKHINARTDRLSYPERFMKDVLQNNGIFEQFTVVQHLMVDKYFLDFALMELKLDIEVDGVQHHRDRESVEHDKKRDAVLRDLGWTIYRISWQEMFKSPKKEIATLIEFIQAFEKGLDRYYDFVIKEAYVRLPRGVRARQNAERKWEAFKEKIKTADIDFQKFGWVQKVADILQIKPQKVNAWMKRYLPETLETAFKRQSTKGR